MTAQVAIIIPAFNAQQTIERSVKSALAQTANVEVVVVDDASADKTVSIVERLRESDARLTIITQRINQGPAAARNVAISVSNAPWLAPLDADDYMSQDRIEKLMEIAQTGAWDFIADDLNQVDENDHDSTGSRLWSDDDIGILPITFEMFVDANSHGARGKRRELGFVKPLMSREFLNQHALSYESDMRLGEDYDLYARALARKARFCLADPCGYTAVTRQGSLSGLHGAKDLAALVDADRRLLENDVLTASQKTAVRSHMLSTHKEWAWLRLIEAVKARQPFEALKCFNAPLPVVSRLLFNLMEQAILRSRRSLRHLAWSR